MVDSVHELSGRLIVGDDVDAGRPGLSAAVSDQAKVAAKPRQGAPGRLVLPLLDAAMGVRPPGEPFDRRDKPMDRSPGFCYRSGAF